MKNQAKPARVFHFDLYGKREAKYDFLNTESIESIPWKELDCPEPYHFFVPKDFSESKLYNTWIPLNQLFPIFNSGVQTKRDSLTINFSREAIDGIRSDFSALGSSDLRSKYRLPEDGRDWKIDWAKSDIIRNNPKIIKIFYRPFDDRFTLHTGKSKGFIAYPREPYTDYFYNGNNFNFILCRQLSTFGFQHCFISRIISDLNSISLQTKEQSYQFPLYIDNEISLQTDSDSFLPRKPNVKKEIVNLIADKLELKATSEKIEEHGTFAPIDILDYVYAILHNPTYREKYKEFLKIDFPYVPYPRDAATFWQLVALGGELRQIHLLESPAVNKYITQYPVGGSNVVEKVGYENGNVYINDTQYFANVPLVAWGFYIGGYQPAQKWLKDRKGRKLEFDDVLHYQNIIVAL